MNAFKRGWIRRLTRIALLFAVAVTLSLVEAAAPSLPVPGVKLGLSNIPVMYALFFIGPGGAFSLAVLKSCFALFTRGAIAGFLSLGGGLLSITSMWLLNSLLREHRTYTLLSLCGVICHNLGQWLAVSLVYAGINMIFYLPVLLISGVAAGVATAVLLRTVAPWLNRLY